MNREYTKKNFSNYINIAVTTLMMLVSAIWFAASFDRRITLLEARDVQHDKEIVQLKDIQNSTFNRLEDKIDKIYDFVSKK